MQGLPACQACRQQHCRTHQVSLTMCGPAAAGRPPAELHARHAHSQVWRKGGGWVPLTLYAVQLALNLAWSPIFFKKHELGFALADITGAGMRGGPPAWCHTAQQVPVSDWHPVHEGLQQRFRWRFMCTMAICVTCSDHVCMSPDASSGIMTVGRQRRAGGRDDGACSQVPC